MDLEIKYSNLMQMWTQRRKWVCPKEVQEYKLYCYQTIIS